MKPEDVAAGPVIVDTDVATWYLLNDAHLDPFRPYLQGRVRAVSFATLGELLAHGHRLSWGPRRQSDWLDNVRRTFAVVPYDSRVAEVWAPLYITLHGRLKGQGVNDLWTAATALAHEPATPVITGNRSDFEAIAKEAPRLFIVHPDAPVRQ